MKIKVTGLVSGNTYNIDIEHIHTITSQEDPCKTLIQLTKEGNEWLSEVHFLLGHGPLYVREPIDKVKKQLSYLQSDANLLGIIND
jgi:hypothetical protein